MTTLVKKSINILEHYTKTSPLVRRLHTWNKLVGTLDKKTATNWITTINKERKSWK